MSEEISKVLKGKKRKIKKINDNQSHLLIKHWLLRIVFFFPSYF